MLALLTLAIRKRAALLQQLFATMEMPAPPMDVIRKRVALPQQLFVPITTFAMA